MAEERNLLTHPRYAVLSPVGNSKYHRRRHAVCESRCIAHLIAFFIPRAYVTEWYCKEKEGDY